MRDRLLHLIEAEVGLELRRRGFGGEPGHYVRREGDVTQVVELQTSVYGARVTANLGLDLAWLEPAVRWVHSPAHGPHAHEAVRWVRVGVAAPSGRDHWWSFESQEELETAVSELGRVILEHGLTWLAREADRRAFLRDAEQRVDRSKGPRHPHGRFAELRLLAAVLAWNGRLEEARAIAELARSCWDEERQRLASALSQFKGRRAGATGPNLSVPDLARELDRLISPTTGVFAPETRPADDRSSSPSGQQ